MPDESRLPRHYLLAQLVVVGGVVVVFPEGAGVALALGAFFTAAFVSWKLF